MASIVQIIKHEGDNNTFVWKHPCEDFNTFSQLIVHESQEAIFFADGKIMDSFGPGRYTLKTQNIPLLSKIINIPTDSETPFHCEIYFINKTVQMATKWGTDSKVRFLDPTLGAPLEIGACGELNLAVLDSKKLLTKLVGTTNGIAWGEGESSFTKSLQNCFRPVISTTIKTHLAAAIKSGNINLFEIDEHLEQLSNVLRTHITLAFEEYGLTIPQFYITNVSLPEHDPTFKRMKDLHTVALQTKMAQAEALVKSAQADAEAEVTAARRKIELEKQITETEIAKSEAERELIRAQTAAQVTKMAGFAEAEVMAAKGYNQKDILQAEVQKSIAEGIGNMTIGGGGGGVAGEMMGLSLGMAAANVMAPQMEQVFKSQVAGTAPAENIAGAKCAQCGASLPAGAKFCLECGKKVAPVLPEGTVICPECKNTVSKGKFCPECGHKFITSCPKCEKELAPDTKFCPECGKKI